MLKLKDLELRLALSSRPNRLGCRVSHDDEMLYVSKLIHEGDFPRICISSIIHHHLCLYGLCRALASLLGRGFLILLDKRWDSFERVNSPSQRPLPTQDNTTYKRIKTNSHTTSGSRSRDPSNQVAKTYAFRTRCRRDRQLNIDLGETNLEQAFPHFYDLCPPPLKCFMNFTPPSTRIYSNKQI
jgi:hypothetical protein